MDNVYEAVEGRLKEDKVTCAFSQMFSLFVW